MKNYKILIEEFELQKKVLNYIYSDEFDKMINNTIFKEDEKCRRAIIYGMVTASMLASQCEHYSIEEKGK